MASHHAWKSIRRIAAIVVLVVAGLAATVGGRGDDPITDPPAASPSAPVAADPIPVVGVAAYRGTLTISVTAAGEAVAWREAVLPAHGAGLIAHLPLRENDVVRAGQEVVRIDPAEYELAVREAQAELERARVQYREATLLDDRIPDPEVRAERERLARARSGMDAAAVRLERAQLGLARTSQRAPFDGRIASIEAEPGEWVSAGDALMRVVDIDPIRVEVQVLDGEVQWLRRGGRAEVEFAALPGETFAGVVASVNPLVDRELRTAKVTVVVENPDGRVLPGMYARVRLEARELADRLLVPRSAILERDRRTMLFALDSASGLAKWRYVTAGVGNDDLVELIEGDVAPGEVVLTEGHYSLIHDARVRLVDDLDDAAGARPE